MADNRDLAALTGNAALDEVTYSDDTAVVQLVRNVQVTGAEGSKTVVENMPASLGQKAMAASFPVVLPSDQTVPVVGNVASGSADSGNPVKVGGVAVDFESMPADVTVGDRVDAAYTPKGIAGVALFHPTLSTPLETLPVSVSSGEVSVSVIGALPGAATGTLSNVNDSASNVTLLASNAARKGASFFNDSTQVLYLKHAATASATSFTTKVQPDQLYELPGPTIYTGIVDGIWAADGAGACRVTELT